MWSVQGISEDVTNTETANGCSDREAQDQVWDRTLSALFGVLGVDLAQVVGIDRSQARRLDGCRVRHDFRCTCSVRLQPASNGTALCPRMFGPARPSYSSASFHAGTQRTRRALSLEHITRKREAKLHTSCLC